MKFYFCKSLPTLIIAVCVLCLLGVSCRKKVEYRIGVSQCSDDDWRELMNEEIAREIMFHPEAVVEIRSGHDDNAVQEADIRYFIDNGFDIILASPNEAAALTPVITEAYESGIPVVTFDRNVSGREYTAFQGADNADIGREAARYAARLLPGGGTAIELYGLPGSTPAGERSRGFHDVVDSETGIRIVASEHADWNYDRAFAVADSLFAIYPDVSLVYAHNDRMALGASAAAARRGIRPYIIGVDAAPDIGMKAVKEGKIDATFLYPTEGEQLIRTAMAILEEKPYDTLLMFPASPAVDRSNVDLLLRQNGELAKETEHMKELKVEIDNYWSRHSLQTAFLYTAIAALVLVCVVLFLVLRAFWQHRRHREQLLEKTRLLQQQRDLEKDLNRQLEEAIQSKLLFFTHVSHDLRTPLTLISEPVEELVKAPNLTDSQRTLMRIADKNVKILHRLINQILDFRKFENGKLDVNLEEASPALYAREWTEGFRTLAAKHRLDYRVDIRVSDDFTMAFDAEKLERVVFNLLSNAFKFTPDKGWVEFRMALEGKEPALRLVVTVADSGRGIPAENLKDVFTRFYRADKARAGGWGLGLSLAKAFVELHGGSITVESEENVGTKFTVSLPVRHTDVKADVETREESLREAGRSAATVAGLLDKVEGPALPSELPDLKEEEGKPRVLVIDDHDDVRLLVAEILKDSYQVIGASGGGEGVRMAARYVPDVVVCDVMMPGIDGIETCRTIKGEISTSHIPVLMLTACSLDEQRVEGYESGADGYMSKPFNGDVLRARIASLISNRKRVLEVYGSAASAVAPAPEGPRRDAEDEFYRRFLDIVKAEMGQPELSVDRLAERMGMGRSQFYRKIKALTGLSPVELLRDMRLKRARDLLLSTDKSVSEIAYEVGFSTPAYFTKCYREVFSETPSALRDRMKK